jgi:hypothetical protein
MLNFYRRSSPTLLPLKPISMTSSQDPKSRVVTPVTWTPELYTAFDECKTISRRPS